tara:strand:+ start:804 stop:1613 length:810 start_codon:yes stop_codon:yes gene_type:complete
MFESDSAALGFELDDGVATITFNRPEARNALNDDVTRNFAPALAWCAESDDVRAVILTGAGGAFCAGADVGRRRPGEQEEPPTIEAQFQAMKERHRSMGTALYALRKPTIAAVPGAAAGAGMTFALACDMRLAATSAFFTTAYARIGLSGDYGVAWLLSRVVTPAYARQLLLTSERVSAEQALAKGLVNYVYPDDALMDEARSLAKQFAAGPPIAYRYIKDNLDEAFLLDHPTAVAHETQRVVKSGSTHDSREARAAFAEKRKPKFQGR